MIYNEYNKNIYNNCIKFYDYEFNSLIELINFIDENEPYWQWYDMGSSLASEKDNFNFTGTKNLKEAKNLCLKGNSGEIEDYIAFNEELKNKFFLKSQKRNFVEDVYGSRLQVSKILTGNPRSMMRLIRNEPLKYINIWVNCACNWNTDRQAITNRGIIISNMIKLLENNGYKVNLNFYFLAIECDEAIYIKVNIKNPGEKLDLSSTYFPMCHPSFLRRIIFAVMERTDAKKGWRDGYGCPVNDVEDYIDISKQDIIIREPNNMYIYGKNLIRDAVNLFYNINFCDYISPGKKIIYDKEQEKIVFVDDEEKGYSKRL